METEAKITEVNKSIVKLNLGTKLNIFKPSSLSRMVADFSAKDINQFFIELIEVKPELGREVLNNEYRFAINAIKHSKGKSNISNFPSMELTEKCIEMFIKNNPAKLRNMMVRNPYLTKNNNLYVFISKCPEIFESMKIKDLIEFTMDVKDTLGDINGLGKLIEILEKKIKKCQSKDIMKINKEIFKRFMEEIKIKNESIEDVLVLINLS